MIEQNDCSHVHITEYYSVFMRFYCAYGITNGVSFLKEPYSSICPQRLRWVSQQFISNNDSGNHEPFVCRKTYFLRMKLRKCYQPNKYLKEMWNIVFPPVASFNENWQIYRFLFALIRIKITPSSIRPPLLFFTFWFRKRRVNPSTYARPTHLSSESGLSPLCKKIRKSKNSDPKNISRASLPRCQNFLKFTPWENSMIPLSEFFLISFSHFISCQLGKSLCYWSYWARFRFNKIF